MDIEKLNYFLVVAKHLNFSRAAEVLYVHQTTLSRIISSIEAEIGTPLFIRMKYSLKLTPVGELLRDRAAHLLQSYDLMRNEIFSAAREEKKLLSIISPQYYYQLLSSANKEFSNTFPSTEEVLIEIYSPDKTASSIKSIILREVDLGIFFSHIMPNKNSDLNYHSFAKEHPCLLTPPDHPLAQRDSLRFSDIKNTVLFVCRSSGYSIDLLRSALKDKDETVKIIPLVNFESVLLNFFTGKGLAILPYFPANANSYLYNYKCIRIIDSLFDFDLSLVWRKDNNNPLLTAFIEFVLLHSEHAQALDANGMSSVPPGRRIDMDTASFCDPPDYAD